MDTVNQLAALLGQDDEDGARDRILQRNMAYALPASVMRGGYLTKLAPLNEMAFQQWVKDNNVPFDPSPKADYDMRGFFQALMSGDQRARTGMNSNDGKLHFGDYFKTPYHESFSAESRYASKGAPQWNELDQLVTPGARIVFDERAKK